MFVLYHSYIRRCMEYLPIIQIRRQLMNSCITKTELIVSHRSNAWTNRCWCLITIFEKSSFGFKLFTPKLANSTFRICICPHTCSVIARKRESPPSWINDKLFRNEKTFSTHNEWKHCSSCKLYQYAEDWFITEIASGYAD